MTLAGATDGFTDDLAILVSVLGGMKAQLGTLRSIWEAACSIAATEVRRFARTPTPVAVARATVAARGH